MNSADIGLTLGQPYAFLLDAVRFGLIQRNARSVVTDKRVGFLPVSISDHTRVVAGSMYPPKTSGLTGSPIAVASTVIRKSPDGASAIIFC